MIQLLLLACVAQPSQPPARLAPEVWLSRAEQEIKSKNWQGLNVVSNQFVTEYPSAGMAWDYLSLSLIRLDRYPEAEKALEQGVKAIPVSLSSWYNLGLVRCHLERPQERIKECLDVLARQSPELAVKFSNEQSISRAISIPPDELIDLGKLDWEKLPSKKLDHYPPYPTEAKLRGIQGTVWVDLVADSSGRTISLGPANGPAALIPPALLCAIQTRFPPVIREGKPRAFKVTYGIPFRLR
jgi:tetratricopeptide (TPR) repeat protein